MLVDDWTEQKKKLIERKYPELENFQKPKGKHWFFNGCYYKTL